MTVWCFFYGGLINKKVMERIGLKPTEELRAFLPGYEIRIAPLVTLYKQEGETAFGLLLKCSHDNLKSVYAKLATTYLPCPVLAFDSDGRAFPALCYIAEDMNEAPAERDHVLNLLDAAEELGFPAWYLDKIRSFLPQT